MTEETTILDRLFMRCLVYFTIENGGIAIDDDHGRRETLTPAEVRQLAGELIALADEVEEVR